MNGLNNLKRNKMKNNETYGDYLEEMEESGVWFTNETIAS